MVCIVFLIIFVLDSGSPLLRQLIRGITISTSGTIFVSLVMSIFATILRFLNIYLYIPIMMFLLFLSLLVLLTIYKKYIVQHTNPLGYKITKDKTKPLTIITMFVLIYSFISVVFNIPLLNSSSIYYGKDNHLELPDNAVLELEAKVEGYNEKDDFKGAYITDDFVYVSLFHLDKVDDIYNFTIYLSALNRETQETTIILSTYSDELNNSFMNLSSMHIFKEYNGNLYFNNPHGLYLIEGSNVELIDSTSLYRGMFFVDDKLRITPRNIAYDDDNMEYTLITINDDNTSTKETIHVNDEVYNYMMVSNEIPVYYCDEIPHYDSNCTSSIINDNYLVISIQENRIILRKRSATFDDKTLYSYNPTTEELNTLNYPENLYGNFSSFGDYFIASRPYETSSSDFYILNENFIPISHSKPIFIESNFLYKYFDFNDILYTSQNDDFYSVSYDIFNNILISKVTYKTPVFESRLYCHIYNTHLPIAALILIFYTYNAKKYFKNKQPS